MNRKPLDKERPYGMVYGVTRHTGALYEQDGMFFDVNFLMIEPKPEKEPSDMDDHEFLLYVSDLMGDALDESVYSTRAQVQAALEDWKGGEFASKTPVKQRIVKK